MLVIDIFTFSNIYINIITFIYKLYIKININVKNKVNNIIYIMEIL